MKTLKPYLTILPLHHSNQLRFLKSSVVYSLFSTFFTPPISPPLMLFLFVSTFSLILSHLPHTIKLYNHQYFLHSQLKYSFLQKLFDFLLTYCNHFPTTSFQHTLLIEVTYFFIGESSEQYLSVSSGTRLPKFEFLLYSFLGLRPWLNYLAVWNLPVHYV